MNKLHTYNVELTATYTINAANEDEAVNKAICRAKIEDLYDYVEEIEYNPEFDDLDSVEINVDEIKKKLEKARMVCPGDEELELFCDDNYVYIRRYKESRGSAESIDGFEEPLWSIHDAKVDKNFSAGMFDDYVDYYSGF